MNRYLLKRRIDIAVLAVVAACTILPGLMSVARADDGRIAAFENGLRPAVHVQGEPAVRWTVEERMEHHEVPGLSVAVIRDGEIAWAKGYGVLQAGGDEPVDTDTVFSVGSVSKVGAAAVTLRLVDAGLLDLDRNVNDYLTRWRLPENAYTAVRPVTLRGILSHSAGLTVHGFPDFQPGEKLPTVIDTLDGRPPAKTDPVRADYVPGSRHRYSGGGTTLEQLVIEEVSELEFTEAAQRYVFGPLGMTRSTYENPLPASHGNIARAHGPDGQPRALPRGWEAMPEKAASGLWTTPSDYARLVIGLIESYQGKGGSFLSMPLAHETMTEVGVSGFGLGPALSGHGVRRVFSHGGANDSYKAHMEGHLVTGNGVVIFTNGANGWRLHREVRMAIAHAENWQTGRAVTVPAIELSADALKEFEGIYALQPASTLAALRMRFDVAALEVSVKDGSVHLGSPGDDDPGSLLPEGVTQFVDAEDAGRRVEFVRDYTGRIGALRILSGDTIVEAVRVAAGSR